MSSDGSSTQHEEALFLRALEIESVEGRREFLDKACGNNRELRERLEMLLAVSSMSDDVLDSPTSVCDDFLRTKSTAFGEFTLVRQIGRGGMGVVYEAVQTSLKRHVAVKLLPLELSLSVNALERFQREVLAAARLHHPNIVTVYFAGQQDGVPYYAMDLVRGPSLDLVIRHLQSRDESGSLRAASFHTKDTVSDLVNETSALAGSVADGYLVRVSHFSLALYDSTCRVYAAS